MSKLCDKICEKLSGELPNFPTYALWEIRRTYAGHGQKSGGAWTFFLYIKDPKDEMESLYSGQIGSVYTATEIAQGGNFVVYYNRTLGTWSLLP